MTNAKMKSPLTVVTRHTFLELAHMTANKKLRLVYFRMMAQYARRDFA